MKKLLLSTAIMVFAGLLGNTASAQLPNGSIAPDFTFRDVNQHSATYNQNLNLYTLLNQGKTVFIDVSATWCGPCWSYHNTNALEDLWINHGLTGGTSVSGSTTNDCMVIFIEGDDTTDSLKLHGGSGSQGDWVTGVAHPIMDPSAGATFDAFSSGYAIAYFPTIYMICPNRVVTEVGQATATALYAAKANCPAPATSSPDAAVLQYTGGEVAHSCDNVQLSALIQNNSTTTLTSATVTAYDGATAIGTPYNYSGSLGTYGTFTAPLGTFSTSSDKTITVKITSGGGTLSTNDQMNKTITELLPGSLPLSNNFSTANFPEPGNSWTVVNPDKNNGWEQITFNSSYTGASGTNDALWMELNHQTTGQIDEVYMPEMHLASVTGPITLEFYVAMAYIAASTNGAMKVMVSSDCGANWDTPWTKSGSTLQTTPPTGTSVYPWAPKPASASTDWRKETVDMSAYAGKQNLLVKFQVVNPGAYGNYIYLDQVNLYSSTGVIENSFASASSVYPNPSNDGNFTLKAGNINSTVKVKVTNLIGQTVYENPSMNIPANGSTLSLAGQPEGIYLVTITNGDQSVVKKVTIAK